MENEEKIDLNKKDAVWHQNFKWWHVSLISAFCLGFYLMTGMAIFDYIFVVGIIYSIVLGFKSKKKMQK